MIELLRRLRSSLASMVGAGVVTATDDAPAVPTVQVQTRQATEDDDVDQVTDDDVEHWQGYGLRTRPAAADDAGRPEALYALLGGRPDDPVALVVLDRRYRPAALERGEVVLYDDQGQAVRLLRAGVVIEAKSGAHVDVGGAGGQAIARQGDRVRCTPVDDATWWTWVSAVSTATGVPYPNPAQLTGTIIDGATKARAS